jgi:hypothetical protein
MTPNNMANFAVSLWLMLITLAAAARGPTTAIITVDVAEFCAAIVTLAQAASMRLLPATVLIAVAAHVAAALARGMSPGRRSVARVSLPAGLAAEVTDVAELYQFALADVRFRARVVVLV